MSGLGAGVGLLEMMGHDKSRALETLGIGAALFECWEGWRLKTAGNRSTIPCGMGGAVP